MYALKVVRYYIFGVLSFLQDNVEDQGDSDPLVVVDESGAGWAGEDFRKQSGGETVNMKPNNPGQSVAATQANSQQHAKSDYKLDRLEDEEQDGDPFAMVEHGQSVSFTS